MIPAEDRLAIHEVTARYIFRCDAKQYDTVSEVFSEDATWDETVVGFPLCDDRPAIHALFCSMEHADLEYVVHIQGSQTFTACDGDTASANSHLHVIGRFNGSDIRILGYYADDFVKIDGSWFIKSRKLVELTPSTGFGEDG